MTYTVEHKIILQTFMNEGLLLEDKTKDLIIQLFNNDKVSAVINQINEKLQPLDMLIKKTQCEITGQIYWVLINTEHYNVTRFQTEFSKNQLALLRIIFSEIVTSNNGCVESIICLNLCPSADVKLPKAKGEEFLNDMVKRKWLAYKDGYYYVGVKSVAELMPYFKATYEGSLSTCCLCKQVIFHGEKCRSCESFFHLYCLKKYIVIRNLKNCPNCNIMISDVDLSGIQDDSTLANINVTKAKYK